MDDLRTPKQRPLGNPLDRAWYDSSQEIFRPRQGDVWGDGHHHVLCGDLLKLWDNGQLAKHIQSADIIHTDPPWTASIYRQFHKWSTTLERTAQPTPFVQPVSFEDFTRALVDICKTYCPSGLIFIDSGLKYTPTLRQVFTDRGGKQLLLCNYTYETGKISTHYNLNVFTFNPTTTIPEGALPTTGIHGDAIIPKIVDTFIKPGMRFFDPLCGSMGFLAPAIPKKATILGVELIPRKFASGLKTLKKYNLNPQLIERNE